MFAGRALCRACTYRQHAVVAVPCAPCWMLSNVSWAWLAHAPVSLTDAGVSVSLSQKHAASSSISGLPAMSPCSLVLVVAHRDTQACAARAGAAAYEERLAPQCVAGGSWNGETESPKGTEQHTVTAVYGCSRLETANGSSNDTGRAL